MRVLGHDRVDGGIDLPDGGRVERACDLQLGLRTVLLLRLHTHDGGLAMPCVSPADDGMRSGLLESIAIDAIGTLVTLRALHLRSPPLRRAEARQLPLARNR